MKNYLPLFIPALILRISSNPCSVKCALDFINSTILQFFFFFIIKIIKQNINQSLLTIFNIFILYIIIYILKNQERGGKSAKSFAFTPSILYFSKNGIIFSVMSENFPTMNPTVPLEYLLTEPHPKYFSKLFSKDTSREC